MRKLLAYLGQRRIAVQLAAMVVLPPIAIHLLITTLILFHRGNLEPPDDHAEHNLGAIIRVIAATPAPGRAALIADIDRVYPQLGVRQLAAADMSAMTDDHGPRGPGGPGGPLHLGPGFRTFPLAGADPAQIGIRLPDGTAVAATDVHEHMHGPRFIGPWSTALLSAVISISLLSLWAAHTLTAPLSAFAKAAESFSLDGDAAPLPERGPDEIRLMARALNHMRERITALMRDRTQMLAAISHDLRTPITRLRLRSEFILDEAQRDQMLGDLDQMRSMLESVLSLLRNDHAREPMTLIDLPALLQQVCEHFSDLGHDITFTGPAHATVRARPDDLGRAITNLADNAVRFGKRVELRLAVLPTDVMIDVDDDGPGIEDARKADMIEPFVRGDAARNLDESRGFGLGLSITRSIIAAHGGTLSLHDRTPHGLTARIMLPGRGETVSRVMQ